MIRALLLLLLATPALGARTTVPPSVEQLATQATGVVEGTVLTAATVQERGEVLTTYTVRRDRLVAGVAEQVITVVLPGGQINDRVITAFGVPVWSIGDRVLLFVDGERPISLSAVFTLRDGAVVDPWQRPLAAMPDRLDYLVDRVLDARLPTPTPAGAQPQP